MNAVLEAAASIDSRVVLGALLVVLDIWASCLVIFSDATRREKTLWVVILIGCPIIGAMFWFVFGPKWRPSSA